MALCLAALLGGSALAVGSLGSWVRSGNSVHLPSSAFAGFTLLLIGGLLLALCLGFLDGLRWPTVRALIGAGLATLLISDAPWIGGAIVTASRPQLAFLHHICLQAAQIAFAADALLALTLSLAGLVLFATWAELRTTLVRAGLVASAGIVIGVAWASHGWSFPLWSRVGASEPASIAILIVATYVVGRLWARGNDRFSAHEVRLLRELRARYRAGGFAR